MQDVIDELLQHGKSVFTINDVAKIMQKPKSYVSKVLSRSPRIQRIERGKYFLSKDRVPDLFEIASQVLMPSYVSLFAAFQFHSITEQIVSKYSVISLERHRQISVLGNLIEFRNLRKDRFFGYRRYGNAFVATVEKAIVDSIFFRSPPLSYVQEAFFNAYRSEKLDSELLTQYALRMKSPTVRRETALLLQSVKPSPEKKEGTK